MPDRTSPVPAVASRASPLATTQHVAAGRGDDGDRALEQHDRAQVGGQPAGGQEPVGGRAMPGEQPVLAVVGRQHGRRRAAVRAPAPRHRRPTPGRTARRRRRRAGRWRAADRRPHRGHRVRLPTEARARRRGRGSGGGRRGPGSTSRTPAAARRTTSARRRRRPTPGVDSETIPLPARIGGRRREVGGAGHPGLPATTRTARDHLCAVGGRGRHHRATSLGLDERGRRARRCRGRCRPPRRRRPGSRPAPSSRPGLRAANVTVRSAASTPRPAAPGEPVDAARDVDGEHRRAARRRAPATRRGTRCRRRRRSRDRTAAAAAGSRRRRTRGPGRRARRSRSAAARPSLPLLPLPAMTVTSAPVGAAEHPPGEPGDGRAGPLDQHLDRLRRGGVDGRHLVRRDDRDHERRYGRGSLGDDHRDGDRPVVAERQVPAHDATVDRQLAARAVTTSDGAPDGSTSTHASWKPNAPRPSPSAFMTASRGRTGPPATAPDRPWARRSRARSATKQLAVAACASVRGTGRCRRRRLRSRRTSTPIPITARPSAALATASGRRCR